MARERRLFSEEFKHEVSMFTNPDGIYHSRDHAA